MRIPVRAYKARCANVPAIVMDPATFFTELKSRNVYRAAMAVLCFTFVGPMHAQQTPAERVAEIQSALRDAKLDGWLFYDFRHSDPLAYQILKLDENMHASRLWVLATARTSELLDATS